MPTKKLTTKTSWVDPDDAPHLTREWFERAALFHGDKLIRPGRPALAEPKKSVHLRLDPEVLDYFRKSGKGWQTRLNASLRKVAGL
ncbi:MAG: BrnA antitoxin family protein [Alphaproteobacteria bacterium]|nr:BrnA antitoxin family protein [Alphaproteobacteria bacterium]